MRILFVSRDHNGIISPFVKEQGKALKNEGLFVDFFLIKGKGIIGYLSNIRKLGKHINKGEYDIVHAHYGLSGLITTFATIKPVVITFHGSDINNPKVRRLSSIAAKRASYVIYVSEKLRVLMPNVIKYSIIPCGIDLGAFYPINKSEARKALNLDIRKRYILFSSGFDNPVKNYPLAKEAVELLNDGNVELLELKGYNRREVNLLVNACDVVLMTSYTEGSPQVIKEALACNKPIVSVDVGDVKDVITGVNNCFITASDAKVIRSFILKVFKSEKDNKARDKINRFDNKIIAARIKKLYTDIVN